MESTKKKKKRKSRMPRFAMNLTGLVAAAGIRTWMNTLDYRVAYYDRSVDPIFGDCGPGIYVFWHENILIPLHLRGHCHLTMLLSQHDDAEILARVAHHMGFDCVRGSTRRGGAKAIWELVQRSKSQHLTITPDGPRGPRRQLAHGPIYLASRLQLPLVPMGFGADRPWRTNSWDRFAIPRPFSRARALIGPAIKLARDLDRSGMELCRQRVEQLMNHLTDEAAAWAESGTRKRGECELRPQSAPRPMAAPTSSVADHVIGVPTQAA
ncbi:MAG TPA: lysophospholipid acyltransferase family protein [Lacipirellulaceae bacterium]|jgi:hypothetical protein|nr:lysophospholipid acyltransferase family protein [Lacipirellulaceae bacterium]